MAKKPHDDRGEPDREDRSLSWKGVAAGLALGGAVAIWLALVAPSTTNSSRATRAIAERVATEAVLADRLRIEQSVKRINTESRSGTAITRLQTENLNTFQARLPQAAARGGSTSAPVLRAYRETQASEKRRLQAAMTTVTNDLRTDTINIVTGDNAPTPTEMANRAARSTGAGAGSPDSSGLGISRGVLLLAVYAFIGLLLIVFTILYHRARDKAKIRTYAAYMERTLGFLLGGPLTEGVLQLAGA